jgi:predicted TPR repeat methyltransferase
MEKYDAHFFTELEFGSKSSASEILSNLKSRFNFDSVMDVGCGVGYG